MDSAAFLFFYFLFSLPFSYLSVYPWGLSSFAFSVLRYSGFGRRALSLASVCGTEGSIRLSRFYTASSVIFYLAGA